MKRILKVILTVVILAGITVPLIGCGSEPGEAGTAETQVVTVERGDITIDITAAGNLALSRTEDLAIDLFYQEGTVEEVMVEEGDVVTEGQALVRLDTEEWEDELEELQDKLTESERQLTAKERALTQAERQVITLQREVVDEEDDVIKAERQVTAEELAVSQAQIDLDTAEYNLGEIDEVKEAQDAVDEAEDNLRLIKVVLRDKLEGLGDFAYWNELKVRAEEDLADAQEELQDTLNDLSTRVSSDVALDVAAKQLQVKQKQLALEDAQLDVEDARKAVADAKYALEEAQLDVEEARHDVEDAQLDVEDAEKALLNAQEKLEDANSKSPLIVAPFDGFITKVNVEGGDEVLTGTVAVQLADPNKFEADIMVSEMDILQVKLGGEAWVQVDAMSGLTLPAEVIQISPTSTIQSGVVNYEVKVEVKSLEAAMQKRQAVISEDFQLREGLTVTVTILVDERTDVLLVPSSAITRQGGQTYVQVVSPDGTIEERAVQTGISDWQYTEITSGLSEGEQVVVPKNTSPTTSTLQPRGPMPFSPPH